MVGKKIITKQMDKQSERKFYLSVYQYGFWGKGLFITILIDFYARMSIGLERKKNGWSNYVLLESQQASGSFPYGKLVRRKFGFQAVMKGGGLQGIKNYLNGREQKTHVRGTFSK